ncbi:MAG: hemolysin-type calcium-binding protein [Cereibacter sphaeroides]|uniref:Hemolysin-type calcium-binding protein n=1 Tax=Cereibacter sphaeroides TaxID=1063 RepID=A0A2W5TX36_CERSP|nr:MAG: hemolysin-type calcium-binding protein [Cereibacter sphaeroides]
MKTGSCGTFVISWSQTEVDGVSAPTLDMLVVGAAWRWGGQPVRVDGAQTILQLSGAEGAEDNRRRAAQAVRRLIGAAIAPRREIAVEEDDAPPTQGFVVTDGLQSFAVDIIEIPQTAARLLLFVGQAPPANRDLWVVRATIDLAAARAGSRDAGGVICFTPGTRLLTPDGPRRIETLRPGDMISTKDNGAQPVAWCGHRRMSGARLHAMPHLRPIRIRSNAFGIGQPDEELIVSPQHRMLVRGRAAQALFNTDEVLVAAEDLLNDVSIMVDRTLREVTYVHVLLEAHQVVWANGLETESFHPANTSLDMIDPAQHAALLAVAPHIAADPQGYGDFARRNLSGPEAAILRHELVG